jgi:hypothetical protein
MACHRFTRWYITITLSLLVRALPLEYWLVLFCSLGVGDGVMGVGIPYW